MEYNCRYHTMNAKKNVFIAVACFVALGVIFLGFISSRKEAGLPFPDITRLMQDSTLLEHIKHHAAENATMEVQLVTCPVCNGSGVVVGYDMYGNLVQYYCSRCVGRGVVPYVSDPTPFGGCHYVHVYDDNDRDCGAYLYYPSSQKIHINGGVFDTVSSSRRRYNRQVKGWKLYFNY